MVAAEHVGGAVAPQRIPPWLGLAISAGLGAGATLSELVSRPGQAVLVTMCCLAGLAAAYIAPGWRGLVAVIVGATATATVIGVVSDSTFGPAVGLLMLFIVTPLAAFGTLLGSLIRRVRELGLDASRSDNVVRVRLLLVVVITIAAVLYVTIKT